MNMWSIMLGLVKVYMCLVVMNVILELPLAMYLNMNVWY